MWYVYQQSSKVSGIDEVYIATDDERIEHACNDLGLNVLMTSTDHPTGTDRVAECVSLVDADYYVNIQGDEPMINPDAVQRVLDALIACDTPTVMASNSYMPVIDPSDIIRSDVVKVVITEDNMALFYSRNAIPYPRGSRVSYNMQRGIYCFTAAGLQAFSQRQPGPLEQAEQVEMLRFLEHGHGIVMAEIEDNGIAVDTEADLDRVRIVMAAAEYQTS